MKKFSSWKALFLALFFVTSATTFLVLNRKVIKMRQKLSRKIKKSRVDVRASNFVFYKVMKNQYALPRELESIPYLSENVLPSVKEISIRNAFAPYNASIIEHNDGFLLFFRYDLVHQMYYNKIHTHIGYAELDAQMNQTDKEFVALNTDSNYSEDPRIFKAGTDFYLIYNDIFENVSEHRGMHLSKFNVESRSLLTKIPIDLKRGPIEKNWAPFVLETPDFQTKICFEYNVSQPRQILSIDNPISPSQFNMFEESRKIDDIPWNKKWGPPLCGTPARLVDGEYLSFFHSKFRDRNGIIWYVMGAYTFEAAPPHRVTKVSPYPILFDGIYDAEYKNTAEPCKCVIFPSSFALQKLNNQDLIHLSCGENDSTIKVLTFNKDALLDTLVPTEK